MKYVTQLVMIVFWVSGLVIAKGFWSTLAAVCFPPWSWYLVVERLLIVNGFIS